MNYDVTIIGAGLAGSEAALSLAARGLRVHLIDMKPDARTPAHQASTLSELVCTNSLKAKRINSASGLLKEELNRLGSFLLRIAHEHEVPAGGALAVDRDRFSEAVTQAIDANPLIDFTTQVVHEIPDERPLVLATGPLTEGGLYESLRKLTGSEHLRFFDAAAPIVRGDSIDPERSFRQSRYGRGGDDYINCPMNKEEYETFVDVLLEAELAEQSDFDRKLLFEGCMPVESMAERGRDTLRFGPMKPVGLTDPRTGRRPWANLQLRQETADGDMWNLVGFQTRLKFPEQRRVFRLIPALAQAEFERYGVMHRNSFIDSPRVLTPQLELRSAPGVFVLGQLTGLEGYVPAIMSGVLAADSIEAYLRGTVADILPAETMSGALVRHITDASIKDFQPMTASFGLLPALSERIKDKQARGQAYADRALQAFEAHMTNTPLITH